MTQDDTRTEIEQVLDEISHCIVEISQNLPEYVKVSMIMSALVTTKALHRHPTADFTEIATKLEILMEALRPPALKKEH